MKILPFGDRALLAEFENLEETIAAYHAGDARRVAGIVELIPAAATVLLRIDPAVLSLRAAKQWLREVNSHAVASETVQPEGLTVAIPVRYDGPDLAATALTLGLSESEFISRHAGTVWRCAFIGFSPGFAYLSSSDNIFDIPRRATSRELVPAGSVALAGEYTGIYPRSSPGGWQIVGTTTLTLWDERREPPAAITPGMTVRFEVVEP